MTISFASYRHGYTSLSDLVGKAFTFQEGMGPDLCQVLPERWKTDAEIASEAASDMTAAPGEDYDCTRAVWVLPKSNAYVSIYSEQVLILIDVGKYDKRCISYEIAVFLVFDAEHPKFVITNSDWAVKNLTQLLETDHD